MKRLSVFGIIIITLLLSVGSAAAETVPDQEVIPVPEFPAIAILIAFIVGIIGAVLYILNTREN